MCRRQEFIRHRKKGSLTRAASTGYLYRYTVPIRYLHTGVMDPRTHSVRSSKSNRSIFYRFPNPFSPET